MLYEEIGIMKKGQEVIGEIQRLDFPNIGIMNTEEGTVLVKGTLPGQKVRARIKKNRRDKVEGQLMEVIEPSPLETQKVCPHFGACGGCSYISMEPKCEMEIKEGQVKRLLEPVLAKQEEPYVWEPILSSPVHFEYRNKMEFSFGDEYMGGPLALGMHKKGSFYDIVTVKDCQIVDEDYRKILVFTRDFFEKEKTPFYHRLRHDGILRHLLIRKAYKTGEILVALVTASGEDPKSTDMLCKSYAQKLSSLELKGELTGILHTWNDSVADVVQSDRTDVLFGRDYIEEEVLGLSFKISEFSFFQTNTKGAELLYETAREFIRSAGTEFPIVYDLYSGTGTIAQLLAPAAKKVIGVEIVEEAVLAARDNAKKNGLDNCEFIAGDVLKVLDEISEKPDFIVLDPPRDGIHPRAIEKIIAYGVESLIYISCKPTSLARDLDIFLAHGYHAKRIVCVNQFMFTNHVETVVLMSRKDK